MRYTDFWLVETAVDIKKNISSINQNVNSIVQSTQEVNIPEVDINANKIFEDLIGYLKQIIAKFSPSDENTPGVAESADEDLVGIVDNHLNVVNNLYQYLPDHAISELAQSMKQLDNATGDAVTEHEKITTGLMAQSEKEYKRGWDESVAFADLKDKDAYTKIKQLTSRFSDTLVNNMDFIKQVKSIFDAHEPKITIEEVDEFLQGAVESKIIDMVAAVGVKQGNLNTHVDPQFKTIFDKVHKSFMGLTDPTATRGSIGPTEIAMIMLGSPTSKANKGDLEIGSRHYEVKASKLSKSGSRSGGRLTGDLMPKNSTIRLAIEKALMKHFKASKEKLKVKKTKKSSATKFGFNLGISGLEFLNTLSENRAVHGGRKARRRAAVIAFLYEFLSITMPGRMSRQTLAGTVVPNKKVAKDIVEAMVNEDGTVDTDLQGQFFQQYVLANFIEYQDSSDGDDPLARGSTEEIDPGVDYNEGTKKAGKMSAKMVVALDAAKTGGKIPGEHVSNKHFDALMFINRDTLQYHIIETGQELVDAIKEGRVTITSGGTFTDAQNPAAVQLYSV